jgi:hypothetical protein
MTYHLAQLNIALFKLPQDHPINADFVNNLDRINAIAANMSVWSDLNALKNIMRRRKEWFDKMEFYIVLWWVPSGHRPNL